MDKTVKFSIKELASITAMAMIILEGKPKPEIAADMENIIRKCSTGAGYPDLLMGIAVKARLDKSQSA